jgi:hypothetical protein
VVAQPYDWQRYHRPGNLGYAAGASNRRRGGA